MRFKQGVGLVLFCSTVLLACNSDELTGSKQLTKAISGTYFREYQEDHQAYISYYRDSIFITAKDKSFELRNVKRLKIRNKDGSYDTNILGEIDSSFTKVPGFGTLLGDFNKTDTTISLPYGKSSVKINPNKKELFFVNNPEVVYRKSIDSQ